SDRICPHDGPGEFLFGTITYGAPVGALAAIIVSVFAGAAATRLARACNRVGIAGRRVPHSRRDLQGLGSQAGA
ncbi:MAG: hypothetical protein ACXVGO_12315, partial [Mycobacterium sp.]